MIPLIILLWIAVQMDAPIWIYVIAIIGIVFGGIGTIADILVERMKKRMEQEKRIEELYPKE